MYQCNLTLLVEFLNDIQVHHQYGENVMHLYSIPATKRTKRTKETMNVITSPSNLSILKKIILAFHHFIVFFGLMKLKILMIFLEFEKNRKFIKSFAMSKAQFNCIQYTWWWIFTDEFLHFQRNFIELSNLYVLFWPWLRIGYFE